MRLFTPEEKLFIEKNLQQDPASLMLQAKRYPTLNVLELVQQIQARQKAINKLPTWAKNLDTVFPVTLSVEQSSSEITAAFKASLLSGQLAIDLTGGFGVDSLYLAKHFKQFIHLEQNEALQQIAAYNFKLLGADNIQSINTTAEAFLETFNGKADLIYLDPARRGNRDEKLHLLQDCEPDVLRILPLLFEKANAVLLKTSPMLDIDQALEQLKQVNKVWVVAVQNEVKEVLYLLTPEQTATGKALRTAVNILPQGNTQTFSFIRLHEDEVVAQYTEPQQYVYEPNAAILKAGAFKLVGQQYGLGKLHPNSHLYTSTALVPDFPGRSFLCTAVCRYNKKELMRYLPNKKANITIRNFPEPVAEIRRKTGIKEGGTIYLFFTTDLHQKPVVLICQKA